MWDLLRIDYVRETFERLEYPEYLLTILGVPKLIAAIVLVAPGLPRMKEWAYAGAMFTYVGAVASHLAVDDAGRAMVTASVYAVLTMVSWALRPPSRRDFTSSRPSGPTPAAPR
jgi:DoxX-like family